MYDYIFFDLDGTLIQSEFGIINSVTYALNKLGIKVEDPATLKKFIGPPLTYAFEEFYHLSADDAGRATAYYRECYDAGEMYNSPLYEGIEEVLDTLSKKGKLLYVVTSKPTYFSEKITDKFGIRKYFKAIIGPELSSRNYTKQQYVRKAMDDVNDDAHPGKFVMIGDRFYDIEGAKANSIASIAVLYGYGNRREFEEAGATHIVEKASDIIDICR